MVARQLAGFSLGFICFYSLAYCAPTWRPLNPEDISAKKSKTDPNADAEALFREVHVLNENAGSVHSEYFRLKIYTERGRDKYGTVQIPYFGSASISHVEGRTIRSDGTIVELARDTIFNKKIVKKNGESVKLISFAMPAVEPGAILEYRWTEHQDDVISRYQRLDVQSEFPVDEVSFHIKPLTSQWAPTMRYIPFGCKADLTPSDLQGLATLTVKNVPAFHEEPYMPPDLAVKQWILIFYEDNAKRGSDAYWKDLGKQLYAEFSPLIKANSMAKSIAAEVTKGAKSDEERVLLLAKYCQEHLKDVHGTEVSTEERESGKVNRKTSDTLKRGMGTPEDINLAFAALALAAGFDARVAKLADRQTFLFKPDLQSGYFLNTYDIAVRVNGKWQFYDVSNRNLAPGQLVWQESGVPALIIDPKESEFVKTPLLHADQSNIGHVGHLALMEDGSLEGDLRDVYSGIQASEWRRRFGQAKDEEREAALREELKSRFSDFEVSKVAFTCSKDASLSVSRSYHIRINGYAERTGKRLFFHPAFFDANFGPRFTAAERTLPVYFDYPWSEIENLEITLPTGFKLDHADAPAPLNFPPVGTYIAKISVTGGTTLIYHREFTFGTDYVLMFDQKFYPAIKRLFDRIQEADNHMLTLKADAQSVSAER